MKGKTNLFIGIGFIVFALVMGLDQAYYEVILYLALGLAFIVTFYSTRISDEEPLKKILVVTSWILIIFSLIWFFYLVRMDQWL